MKTYEMQYAVSPQSLKIFNGAVVVSDVTFASGADIIEDAREIGLGGFHLLCKSSYLFTLLTRMLDAGAHVLGTGLIDRRIYGDEYETITTLKIGVDPQAPDTGEKEKD